jgi:DNA excision repair protein ERCC-4
MNLETGPVVLVDDRERRSRVLSELARLGVRYQLARLEVADYDVGGRYGVERKTAGDFINSLIDGRLFEQAKYLRDAYDTAIIVIEGDLMEETRFRQIKLNPLFGAFAALAENGVSVLQVSGFRETALLIYVLWRRLQKEGSNFLVRTKKKVFKETTSVPTIQLNLIATLPGISREMAEKILLEFKTPRKFFTASPVELRKINGLGPRRIQKILQILDTNYEKAKLLESKSDHTE